MNKILCNLIEIGQFHR